MIYTIEILFESLLGFQNSKLVLSIKKKKLTVAISQSFSFLTSMDDFRERRCFEDWLISGRRIGVDCARLTSVSSTLSSVSECEGAS